MLGVIALIALIALLAASTWMGVVKAAVVLLAAVIADHASSRDGR